MHVMYQIYNSKSAFSSSSTYIRDAITQSLMSHVVNSTYTYIATASPNKYCIPRFSNNTIYKRLSSLRTLTQCLKTLIVYCVY